MSEANPANRLTFSDLAVVDGASLHGLPGHARRLWHCTAVLAVTVAAGLLFARVSLAATFTVDSTADAVDANPGDGVCATAVGECTLRAAFGEANAVDDGEVHVPPGTYKLSMASSLSKSSGFNITVAGTDAASTIIDGNHATVFENSNTGGLTLIGLSIVNGDVGVQISVFESACYPRLHHPRQRGLRSREVRRNSHDHRTAHSLATADTLSTR